MFRVKQIHHASFLISDLGRAEAFYREVVGLESLDRPDLGYPGCWLAIGDHQQLHLMQLPNPDNARIAPEHGGRDRHLA